MPLVPTVSFDPPDHPLVPALEDKIKPLLHCSFPDDSENMLPEYYPHDYEDEHIRGILDRVNRWMVEHSSSFRWYTSSVSVARTYTQCAVCGIQARRVNIVNIKCWEPLGSGSLAISMCKRSNWDACDLRAAVRTK